MRERRSGGERSEPSAAAPARGTRNERRTIYRNVFTPPKQKLDLEKYKRDLELAELEEKHRMKHAAPAPSPNSPGNLPDGSRKLLKYIAEKGGRVAQDEFRNALKGESNIRAQYYLDRALEAQVLEAVSEPGRIPVHELTAKGRKFVVDHKLDH